MTVWIDTIKLILGVYTPITTEIALPIYSTTLDGSVYISSYEYHNQVVSGISGVNFEYIFAFILFIGFMTMIMRFIQNSVGKKQHKLI